jgi:hypothetical protein
VLQDLRGYSTLYNIGTNSRGTAIIAREGITLVNLTRLPSGHAIAAKLKDCSIINVYAPSGTARRQDRETFYSCELPHVLTQESRNVLMAGGFNCTLEQGDSTEAMNHCRALTELLRGMELRDAWNRSAERPGYTHYSVNGSSRLDRICVTKDLSRRKQGIEMIVATFTDHFAVSLHLMLDVPILRMERGYWKLDHTLLEDSTITEQLTTLWCQLLQQKRCFLNVPMWWDQYCKRRLMFHATGPSGMTQGTSGYGKLLFFLHL